MTWSPVLMFTCMHSNLRCALGEYAQEGYDSWVCVFVCVSVKLNLTSGASARHKNTVMYSVCNGGQKFVGISLKPLCCKDTPLPAL